MTWRPASRDDPRPPRRVGASLDSITRALGAPDAASLKTLFDRWDDLAGPELGAHTRPLSLVQSVLSVAVDDPAWAAQLSYSEGTLLRRLEEVLGTGAVTRVRVRVRPR